MKSPRPLAHEDSNSSAEPTAASPRPLTRRQAVTSGLLLGGAAALTVDCSGLVGPGGPPDGGQVDAGEADGGHRDGGEQPDGSTASNWAISGAIFTEGSGGSFDLKPTLPVGTPAGGTFGVDASGSPLPAGMSLSVDGILSVGGASAATVDGVIFFYDAP